MYANSAYINNRLHAIKDKSKPLIVTSCGTYRLYTKQKLPTLRPRGRVDYQLLYIAARKAHFYFDGKGKLLLRGIWFSIAQKNLKNMIIFPQ